METKTTMQCIDQYMTDVLEEIYEPVIQRELGPIPLDRTKCLFILLPMLNDEEWSKAIYQSALAVGAVHAAFDAHDAVSLEEATSIEQQLTVLAGDHFSGIHYRLLASSSDFLFIRSLSNTIGRVNEMKTRLHLEQLSHPEQLIQHLEEIEAGCIVDFYHTYGFTQYSPFVKIALSLIRLQQEMSKWQSSANKASAHRMMTEAIHSLSEKWHLILQETTFLKNELVDDLAQLVPISSESSIQSKQV